MNEEEEPRTTLVDDLKKLDQEYLELSVREDALIAILRRLQEEETTLHLALQEASETGEQRMQQALRDKDQAAIARLEQALMGSSSDEEDTNAADGQSLFSFPKFSGGSNSLNFKP
jgi:hypothetical protein